MLDEDALFIPAISYPVPWSGDVLTKGKFKVTLTPVSKAIILNGTKP